MKKPQPIRFALCMKNTACEDLVIRKVYAVLPDERAEKDHYVRIIDESGEDYLYPASFFCMVELPQTAERALRRSLPLAV